MVWAATSNPLHRIAGLAFAALLGATSVAIAAPVPIEIAEGGLKLRALMYRPSGPGPFPAVVALHDCAGLAGLAGPMRRRYRDWGERLVAAGYVVVFHDSFASRGVAPQCAFPDRRVRAQRERFADAVTARRWLQSQDFVAKGRVALIGWANGAIAALWAVRRQPGRHDAEPDFRSATAFYPGCRRLAETAWSARVPTLILIGAKDDWSPARACEQMVAGARGRTARAAIVVYPGAHHGFDHPNLPLQLRTGVAFSADGSGRVHVGSDPRARADAIKRVTQWLAR